MLRLTPNEKHWIRSELEHGELVVWLSHSSPFYVSRTRREIFFRFIRYSVSLTVVFLVFPLFFAAILFVIAMIRFSPTKRLTYSVYIITNRRAIILNDVWVRAFDTYHPHQLKKFNLREDDKGAGNIIFRATFVRDNNGYLCFTALGFKNIASVNKVGDLLLTLANSKQQLR